MPAICSQGYPQDNCARNRDLRWQRFIRSLLARPEHRPRAHGALAPLAGCRDSPSLSFSRRSCGAAASFRLHGCEIVSTCQPWTRAVKSGTATKAAHNRVVRARTAIAAEMAIGCLRPLLRRERRSAERLFASSISWVSETVAAKDATARVVSCKYAASHKKARRGKSLRYRNFIRRPVVA